MVPVVYNVRSLTVRKTTTIATLCGIALVVFVLAATLMLAEGIRKTLGKSGDRRNAVVLRKGSDAELASSIADPLVGIVESAPGVAKDGQGNPIGVGEVVVVLTVEKEGTAGQIANVQTRGVPADVMAFRPSVKLVAGRPLQPGTDEAMIGKRLVGRYKGLELGKPFELKKNRPVTVVGIFEDGGSSFESELWADLDTVRSSFGRQGLVSSVRVRLESPSKFEAFEAAVESDRQLGLEAMREDVFYEKQSEGTSTFITVMGVVISVFFSLGAMIGAMITMYASVAHRQREIGTLRALGFSRAAILGSFVLESLLLALAGGVLGALAALGMGFVKFELMNFATWSEIVFSFSPTPGILTTAVLFGGLMGLLGGFLPAVRAARISPVEAMRG